MSTMEQALRDHGLIVLQVEDVKRLLGKWQYGAQANSTHVSNSKLREPPRA